MYKAYVTNYTRYHKGAKYALYQEDTPLETHTFPVPRSGGTDAIFIGIINAMLAALRRGAEELLVYVANDHVLWCIEHPAAVRNPQTITYLMNIHQLRTELPTCFVPAEFTDINIQVMVARKYLETHKV